MLESFKNYGPLLKIDSQPLRSKPISYTKRYVRSCIWNIPCRYQWDVSVLLCLLQSKFAKICFKNFYHRPQYIEKLLCEPVHKIHCPPQVHVQPALLFFFSFVHNSLINELKNMKLREHICCEMINWILHYCGFGNSL